MLTNIIARAPAKVSKLSSRLRSLFRLRANDLTNGLKLELRLVGSPETEVNPGLCLAKAELLFRMGRIGDALRFSRAVSGLGKTRREAGGWAVRAAAQDVEFRVLVDRADQARDNEQWTIACALYERALCLYPDHFGYLVQYGHCLKELRLFGDAECAYRSALALGAEPLDVDEHLRFVVVQQGVLVQPWADESPQACGAAIAMTGADVDIVMLTFMGREPSLAEKLEFLRGQRKLHEVILSVIQEDGFFPENPRWCPASKL